MQLRIEIDKVGLKLDREATVRRTEPRDAETWWIGCAVEERIPDEVIAQMAAARILNRRRDPRYPTNKKAEAKWQLSDSQVPVRLVDYSKGGFCMTTEQRVRTDSDRILLIFPSNGEATTLPARVVWQRESDDGPGMSFGCAFSNLEGFALLRAYADPLRAERERDQLSRVARGFKWSIWVAIAVLVLLTVNSLQLAIRLGKPASKRVETLSTSTADGEPHARSADGTRPLGESSTEDFGESPEGAADSDTTAPQIEVEVLAVTADELDPEPPRGAQVQDGTRDEASTESSPTASDAADESAID